MMCATLTGRKNNDKKSHITHSGSHDVLWLEIKIILHTYHERLFHREFESGVNKIVYKNGKSSYFQSALQDHQTRYFKYAPLHRIHNNYQNLDKHPKFEKNFEHFQICTILNIIYQSVQSVTR